MRRRDLLLILPAVVTWGTIIRGKNKTLAENEKIQDLSIFFEQYQGTFVMLDVNPKKSIRYNKAQSAKQLSPCSTFKILNSLIGLETGVIPDENYLLRWDGTQHPIEPWNQDHTLRTAFSNSVVWYYQAVAAKIGEERMKKYIQAVHYGNEDLSGGITKFWLESSLKISADEQVDFLYRFHTEQLPFSKRSLKIVKEIMTISETDGKIFRGKTGTAGNPYKDIATLGWFVGTVTNEDKAYIFATNIIGGTNPSGRTARRITVDILKSMRLI